jgi:TRL-like protein family
MATRRGGRRALAAALGPLLVTLGCAIGAGAPVRPPGGYLFTYVSAPVDTNFSSTPVGSKVGTADSRYLYIPVSTYVPLEVAFGDAAVKRAADDAGITTIHYIDYTYLRFLGIYEQLTIRVYGD